MMQQVKTVTSLEEVLAESGVNDYASLEDLKGAITGFGVKEAVYSTAKIVAAWQIYAGSEWLDEAAELHMGSDYRDYVRETFPDFSEGEVSTISGLCVHVFPRIEAVYPIVETMSQALEDKKLTNIRALPPAFKAVDDLSPEQRKAIEEDVIKHIGKPKAIDPIHHGLVWMALNPKMTREMFFEQLRDWDIRRNDAGEKLLTDVEISFDPKGYRLSVVIESDQVNRVRKALKNIIDPDLLKQLV